MAQNGGAGIPIGEAADRLGVSFSHLSKVEIGIGAFSPRFVESVAREFRVSLGWLMTGEGEMTTCEVTEAAGKYVVRMVERTDPARIAALVLDPKVVQQAKQLEKLLGVSLQRATEIVVAERLREGHGMN